MSITSERLLKRLVEDVRLHQAATEENPQSKLTDLLREKMNKTLAEAEAYTPKADRASEPRGGEVDGN